MWIQVRSANRVLGGLSAALLALLSLPMSARADNAAFDLTGPRVDMKVSRGGKPLPISEVANLQAGDRLRNHPGFPHEQYARYLPEGRFLFRCNHPAPRNWINPARPREKHAVGRWIHASEVHRA